MTVVLTLKSSLYDDCDCLFRQPKRSSWRKMRQTASAEELPFTPKNVSFADAFGLDLIQVRDIFDFEKPPEIPDYAMPRLMNSDLDVDDTINKKKYDGIGAFSSNDQRSHETFDLSQWIDCNPSRETKKFFKPCFYQGCHSNILNRVTLQSVCLESATIKSLQLSGCVRVKNISYEKRVVIRITMNSWSDSRDHEAVHFQHCHLSDNDLFRFEVAIPASCYRYDTHVEFAICYTCNGRQFWDNNFGKNYAFVMIDVPSDY